MMHIKVMVQTIDVLIWVSFGSKVEVSIPSTTVSGFGVSFSVLQQITMRSYWLEGRSF